MLSFMLSLLEHFINAYCYCYGSKKKPAAKYCFMGFETIGFGFFNQ
jgi:hypothetical protein